jgi:hypothetical protein
VLSRSQRRHEIVGMEPETAIIEINRGDPPFRYQKIPKMKVGMDLRFLRMYRRLSLMTF